MSFFLFEWDKFRASPQMLARPGPEWAVCSGPDEGGGGPSQSARAALQEMVDKIK